MLDCDDNLDLKRKHADRDDSVIDQFHQGSLKELPFNPKIITSIIIQLNIC